MASVPHVLNGWAGRPVQVRLRIGGVPVESVWIGTLVHDALAEPESLTGWYVDLGSGIGSILLGLDGFATCAAQPYPASDLDPCAYAIVASAPSGASVKLELTHVGV